MKRIFNKKKCIKDLKQFDPWLCEASEGWINMCDGREVITGIVTGDKGEEYFVSTDWTDVVEDEKVTIDKHNNKKPVTNKGIDKASPCSKRIFSRDLYIKDMDKYIPEVNHAETGWAKDCDGAEVINGKAMGKKGRLYAIDDAWTKEVPIDTDQYCSVPVEEKKTKRIFSKEKYLATGDKYYPWVDDCDGVEVLNGMAIGESGIEYFMHPDWVKEVPVTTYNVTTDSYKIEIKCNDGKTTTAVLYKNGEKIKDAITRCSDEDTFDLFKGATLALNRLLL